MASPPNGVYFPSLDECLKGDKLVLSWKLVASALQDASTDRLTSPCLKDFLQDRYVTDLIRSPATAFTKPTPQSRADFETKTAAIHVTPTPNEKYDIKAIKEDSLWLSSSVGINEVAALRIVVIEFQNRPQSYLAGPFSAQDIINLHQAVGADGTQANTLLAFVNAADTADADTIWADFNTQAGRRRRLVDLYMSERRYLMAFVDGVLNLILNETLSEINEVKAELSAQVLMTIFGQRLLKDVRNDTRQLEKLVSTYLELVPECLTSPDSALRASVKDVKVHPEELELVWTRTSLTETLHLLASIFRIIDLSSVFLSADIVSRWFRFVDAYGFLDQLQGSDDLTAEVIQPIKHLICIISMRILNLPRAIMFLDGEISLQVNEDSYFTSGSTLKEIHESVVNAANASLLTSGPVIFSWALILQRMLRSHHERLELRDLQQNRQAQEGFERELEHVEERPGVGRRSSAGSVVSMETQSYDQFLSTSFASNSLQWDLQEVENLAGAVTAGGQLYDFMTDMALSMGGAQNAAFRPSLGSRVRHVLLDFLKFSFPVTGYISEPVTTLLAVLSAGQGYWDIPEKKSLSLSDDVVAVALDDPLILQFYILQALQRYPYEFLPFTSLCKILSTCLAEDDRSGLILKSLLKTPTLTLPLPDPYWQFTADEEELGKLELTQDFPLFAVSPNRKRLIADEEPFCIPAGTFGNLASDTGHIAQVQFEHSTIALLGKRLEANLAPDSYELALGPLQADELAETVSLLATAIRCENIKASAKSSSSSADVEAGLAILQEASRALPRTKDIVSVICDTLDYYVDGELANLEASRIRVMTTCLQFLDSILSICPGRVWSYMTRCDLLISDSRAGRLSRITGTLDLVDERFELLSTVVKFFSNLVANAMKGTIQKKIGSKASGRSVEKENPWLGTSDKAMVQVNLSIAHTAIDILENSLTWRFSSEIHRSILVGDLIPVLDNIVTYSLSVSASDKSNTLTAFLEPAAQHIVDGFLSSSSSSLRFQPLLSSMLVALGMPDSSLYPKRSEIISKRQVAVLDFATTLVRVANYLGKPTVAIEDQILKCSSLLARLCATDTSYKNSVLSLLGAMAERLGREDTEAPSLLGYLGPHISRSFLQTISQLDKPFERPAVSRKTWKFFSTIMRNGQHWMANCLLTGKTPREALGNEGKLSKLAPDSILRTALTRLRSIRTLSTSETLAILDLLTSAHNFWQWTVFASQEDNSCLAELRAYVRQLKSASVTAKVNPSQACDEARIAAYIAEALAMHLYHLRKTGREEEFAQELVNDVDYYLREGVTVSGYNSSLHANFAKNFSKQYPGFSLESFQRTLLIPRELGDEYYYALNLADKMLRFDPGWAGPRERNGFRHEMAAANLNLSLVDAQIMMQVTEQCLVSNQGNQGPERIFQRITQSRANLAMVLVQRLTDASLVAKDIAELLEVIWTTLNGIDNPFTPDQIQYWRTMLRMLYVVLRGYRTSPAADGIEAEGGAQKTTRSRPAQRVREINTDGDRIVEVLQCVLNILQRVVAQGFRSLVALIHDPVVAVLPEDLALLTAILQACLCLPGIDQVSGQVLNIMISEDVGQAATSLLSWADKLAVKGDPVYGELSILFLLQLSNVPVIAEHLASDGLLGQLTSANITTHIQRPNVSPFADNVGAQRCYDIWAKGILPLLLNVLSAPGLGPNVATEVACVLNQFPNLLHSSVDRIEAPGMSRTTTRGSSQYVTLLGVSEINSLALLTQVLGKYRSEFNHEIPEVSWDSATALENVDYWLTSRKILRERLLPLGQREADWRTMKTGIEEVSVLEQKVVSLLETVKEVLGDDSE
ncbi:hypothetical protein J7T55_009103 [Diaporthe amygdali]|uniref:uncharacterized protein n=1 Tax=Phomopsis amygdali TaxID=1214568 RepID=UPI0022FDED65|nr:uncharacterized protein J7T55_009103 [Diaporthe amygdali]KAJ0118320.1 hypothetical protein J7T55_009103 [Diaporthe amygdali]